MHSLRHSKFMKNDLKQLKSFQVKHSGTNTDGGYQPEPLPPIDLLLFCTFGQSFRLSARPDPMPQNFLAGSRLVERVLGGSWPSGGLCSDTVALNVF